MDPGLRGGGFAAEEWCRKMPLQFGARMWRRSNEEADCLLAGLERSSWIQVHYEELCADPAVTLRRIARFLGLDPARVVLDFRTIFEPEEEELLEIIRGQTSKSPNSQRELGDLDV